MSVLPEEWSSTTLGEIGNVSGGSTPSTKIPAFWGGTIPWLAPSEVSKQTQFFLDRTERTITEAGLAGCAARLLPPGTVMITSRATIGEVAINSVPMATNQGFINVVCDTGKVVNEFLGYWIKQNKDALVQRAHGVTFKEISKSVFKTVRICLPPIPEQIAIVTALRAVQEARDSRRRELELERERKAALMEELFTRGLRGEPLKETEIGPIPQSWHVRHMRDLAKGLSGGTPSKKRSDWWEGSIPWASPKDMKRPRLSDTIDHITDEAAENGSRIVPAGTVFVVIRGMILAKDFPIAITEVPMAFNQDMKAYVPFEDVNGAYLLYLLVQKKTEIRTIIGTSAHGTRRIGSSSLDSLLLPVPSDKNEQRAIAEILTTCDKTIESLETEARLLDELFRALLDDLMTGRISVLPLVAK